MNMESACSCGGFLKIGKYVGKDNYYFASKVAYVPILLSLKNITM